MHFSVCSCQQLLHFTQLPTALFICHMLHCCFPQPFAIWILHVDLRCSSFSPFMDKHILLYDWYCVGFSSWGSELWDSQHVIQCQDTMFLLSPVSPTFRGETVSKPCIQSSAQAHCYSRELFLYYLFREFISQGSFYFYRSFLDEISGTFLSFLSLPGMKIWNIVERLVVLTFIKRDMSIKKS